ncbi:hypothetical protein CR513_05585, partial [Mucuna pruriens]
MVDVVLGRFEKRPKDWEALKTVMRARFVPSTYTKDLHDRLQRLYQGTRSIEKYHKEMEMNLVRAQIRESKEALMAQFHGLKEKYKMLLNYNSIKT